MVRDGRPGIFFLSIEAGKWLPAFLARTLIRLPYKTSAIERDKGNYTGRGDNTVLDLQYRSGAVLKRKGGAGSLADRAPLPLR